MLQIQLMDSISYSFYIECMDCIGIDEKEWSIPEICRDCIFSEKCVNGEE